MPVLPLSPTNGVVSPEYARKVTAANTEAARQQAQAHQQKRAAARESLSRSIAEGRSSNPSTLEDSEPMPLRIPGLLEGRRDVLIMGAAVTLLGFLSVKTWRRHKLEAAVRPLAGKYIADGMEAVDVRMPDLFGNLLLSSTAPPPSMTSLPSSAEPAPAVDTDAFTAVRERIQGMQVAIQDFGRATEEEVQKRLLGQMLAGLAGIKEQSRQLELRPLHQVSCALELLIQRLADKKKDITPSSIRTIANAIDLLEDLCITGIPPDLLTNPPVRVLAVDDDPLCLRAVMFALEKASLHPDSASNGEKAVSMTSEKTYDVILMDIQMPGLDGLQACEQIRGAKQNADTPIVFVTIQSDFHTRASSAVVGGTDFIAKPFLIFEITVKTLTFAARKRLKAVEKYLTTDYTDNTDEKRKSGASLPPSLHP